MAGPGSWQRLGRLQVAGLTSGSWAWSASVGWRLLTYCVPDPGPGPQFLLGERQGAVVSPSPGWRLTTLAPGTPLYVPGAPWAVRGTAGTHAPG